MALALGQTFDVMSRSSCIYPLYARQIVSAIGDKEKRDASSHSVEHLVHGRTKAPELTEAVSR
jgi:hypothetical protein